MHEYALIAKCCLRQYDQRLAAAVDVERQYVCVLPCFMTVFHVHVSYFVPVHVTSTVPNIKLLLSAVLINSLKMCLCYSCVA